MKKKRFSHDVSLIEILKGTPAINPRLQGGTHVVVFFYFLFIQVSVLVFNTPLK